MVGIIQYWSHTVPWKSEVTDESPEAVLAATMTAYRQCTTYDDAGVVLDQGEVRVSFETRFVRGSLFSFSYAAPGRDGVHQPRARVVSRDGGLDFWTVLGGPQPESLRLCIAALTGISSGSAHGASSLLLEEVGGWLPTELTNPERLADEEVFGVPCYHVRGGHPSRPGSWSLFVEHGTHLIRRRVAHHRPADITEYERCSAR